MSQSEAKLHAGVEDCLNVHGLEYKVFQCDPALADTAAFCQHYGFAQEQAANAVIVASKSEPVQFACCLVLASTKLDVNKKVCQLLAVKRASFATAEQTAALTGMLIGGVTPFGLPEMPIYVDSAVMTNQEIVVGGGNRSTKVLLNPEQLKKLPGMQIVDGLSIAR